MANTLLNELDSWMNSLIDAQGEQSTSLRECWQTLRSGEGQASIQADDANARSLFVTLQGFAEMGIAHLLAEGKIRAAAGVIHTETPAMPLRQPIDAPLLMSELSETVQRDPAQAATIPLRAHAIRQYLSQGARLTALYSATGTQAAKERARRAAPASEGPQLSDVSLGVLTQTQQTYPYHLSVQPRNGFTLPDGRPAGAHLPNEFSGATYLLEDNDGQHYCFSIQSYQSNQPSATREWGLWCGSLEQERVQERFDRINGFLKANGVDLENELALNRLQRPAMRFLAEYGERISLLRTFSPLVDAGVKALHRLQQALPLSFREEQQVMHLATQPRLWQTVGEEGLNLLQHITEALAPRHESKFVERVSVSTPSSRTR
jgi:hypothetical protein